MDNSVQIQIDKMKVDIKTLMSAVKKLVLEQRETNKNVEKLDGKIKHLKMEKEKKKDTTELESNLLLLKNSNCEMSLKVNNFHDKLNKIDAQVEENVIHLNNIDTFMNNAKEKASEISCNEPSKSIAMSEIRDKIKVLDDKIVSYENEIKAIEGRIKEYSSKTIKKQTGQLIKRLQCLLVTAVKNLSSPNED